MRDIARFRMGETVARRLEQPDPAADGDGADLGRPRGRQPPRRRRDRADDADVRALGGRARPDPFRRAQDAARRFRDAARPLALRQRDGRARLHRASTRLFYAAGAPAPGAINLSIIQGAIPALRPDRRARFGFGDTVSALQALGAFAAMVGVAAIAAQGDWSRLAGLAFNVGDLDGADRLPASMPATRWAARAAARLAARVSRRHGARRVRHLAAAVRRRGRGGRLHLADRQGLLLLLYAALGPAFVAQLFYMRGVELIGPGRAGVFVNLVPAFGALMAVVLLGEPFAAYHVVALALVVGGIAIAQRAPRQRLAGAGRRDLSTGKAD